MHDIYNVFNEYMNELLTFISECECKSECASQQLLRSNQSLSFISRVTYEINVINYTSLQVKEHHGSIPLLKNKKDISLEIQNSLVLFLR